jgi:hypothetical protein
MKDRRWNHDRSFRFRLPSLFACDVSSPRYGGIAKEGLTGFAYFNNDMNTRAPLNALRLMEHVGLSARYLRERVKKSEAHTIVGSP